MRHILIRVARILLLVSLFSAPVGYMASSWGLHPARRALTAEKIILADSVFRDAAARREDLDVRAPDGILLRGWIVYPADWKSQSNGKSSAKNDAPHDWVLLLHGVADNRTGVLGQAAFLLRSGYGVVMMDSRAHGESEGSLVTYGWKERDDVRAIVDALENKTHVGCLFALGVSMGGGIALQAAAVEPRIAGVVAESPFSSFREASYDYGGLHWIPWLGRTIFRPGVEAGLLGAGREGRFHPEYVSPELAVTLRPFPVFLIADAEDTSLPVRHQRIIYNAATGPKQLWIVPGATHAAAIGMAPEEYQRRVLEFFAAIRTSRTCANN